MTHHLPMFILGLAFGIVLPHLAAGAAPEVKQTSQTSIEFRGEENPVNPGAVVFKSWNKTILIILPTGEVVFPPESKDHSEDTRLFIRVIREAWRSNFGGCK